MKKNRILTIIYGALALAVLLFIFSNSLRNGEESMNQSSFFVTIFQAIFDPNKNMPLDDVTYIVRKLAHFTEFFILGLTTTMFLYHLGKEINKRNYILPFFICLLSASIDEFIQNFTGRTSSGVDVIIDFSGSSLAIAIIIITVLLIEKSLAKKQNNANLQ